MTKLSSFKQLDELRHRILADQQEVPRLVVCAGTGCQASGANSIQRVIKRHLVERDLIDRISLRITGCHGFCEMGPSIITEPQGAFYVKVKTQDVPRIISALLSGSYVEDLLYRDASGEPCFNHNDIPFIRGQHRALIGRNQRIDPIRINDFLADGGYGALAKALKEMKPNEVIEEVRRGGLRGRGGAGFPTATKWELLSQQPSKVKYLVCNADEGDPGAFMDQGILEGNPHSVIEGMILGAFATGATEGFIFVRHEYPLAIKHTLIAIRAAEEYGLLGENILGTDFSFKLSIVKSAGAFVCGEETALIRTIEGFMGEPRQRPPFPIKKGIDGYPTCINNVETWANVPIIVADGAASYAEVGTKTCKGTKVFSVVGKVRNTGLVEVPMGVTINNIVHDIGGGPPEGSTIKAVQIGGPAGGCIPSSRFDLPIDYDSLREAGAIMGSGGMIVMDDKTCMVDVAKYFMNFLKDESCGKCFTCRKGTQRMYEILDGITKGESSMDQIELLQELAEAVADTTMCGLGQAAPNPVLSTLRYFRDEYERHIIDKRCDGFVCKDLVGAPCQSACPVGTEAWRYIAHIGRGEYEEAYQAIREHNPLPSICARVCDHKCEHHCRLEVSGDRAVAIRSLKRFITDRFDPADYKQKKDPAPNAASKKVAIVGGGPAGLAAANALTLRGYQTVLFDSEKEPGGMLLAGIPSYRLPREVLRKEVAALLSDVEVRCNTTLGQEITVDGLLGDGFDAVFLALGAHRSRPLGLEGEDAKGIYPSMTFLKSWNLHEEGLAKGRVGVIGGGNSAFDAARVALRQPGVEEVTIYYRRTENEMPAFKEEITAAVEEGIKLEPLVSPVGLELENGQLKGLELVKNDLGEIDSSGRRRPVANNDTKHKVAVDTLVVAIGEQAGTVETVDLNRNGTVNVDERTLVTSRENVFAGGDVVTGPNTVIDAVAAGQNAARRIDRYLQRQSLDIEAVPRIPEAYIEPMGDAQEETIPRVEATEIAADKRASVFDEVELTITEEQAKREASRCLRCDLEFTKCEAEEAVAATGGHS